MNDSQNYTKDGKPTSGGTKPTKGQLDGSGANDNQVSGTNNLSAGAGHGNTANGDRRSDDGRHDAGHA